MDILVDTGALLRLTIPTDPAYPAVRRAIGTLLYRKEQLISLNQNAAEFWNVCTRPATARGGYGLSIQDALRKLRLIERIIDIRPDSQRIFQEWKRLVVSHSVQGVQVHDARLVAAMNIYGIAHILTFNGDDFRRYSHITALDPNSI